MNICYITSSYIKVALYAEIYGFANVCFTMNERDAFAKMWRRLCNKRSFQIHLLIVWAAKIEEVRVVSVCLVNLSWNPYRRKPENWLLTLRAKIKIVPVSRYINWQCCNYHTCVRPSKVKSRERLAAIFLCVRGKMAVLQVRVLNLVLWFQQC